MSLQNFTRLAIVASALALLVVVLGAYVRLSHAGLSCPDWPGCYGRLGVPLGESAIADANQAYPERPVDVPRAWKEMAHRYLAGVLGLLVLALAFFAWRRRLLPGQRLGLPMGILALVIVQALLGMWTVTLLLKPLVVTAHLLGGMTVTMLLWWLALRHGGLFSGYSRPLLSVGGRRFGPWVVAGIVVVYLQIFLGGWTSTNYAALACTDFPLCQGEVVPSLDLKNALTFWHGLGRDYEGGILATDARVTIHFLHRLGAAAVFVYVGLLGFYLLTGQHEPRIKRAGSVLVLVLFCQVGLGIGNVLLSLPLPVAVLHNGGAALLLVTLATVYHIVRPPAVVV